MREILIVGGGLSGAALAAALLERSRPGSAVRIIEPRPELGRGLAYSSVLPGHLLNAEAYRFSLQPDDPDHFLRWLARHVAEGGWPDAPADLRHAYVPRAIMGLYAQQVLARAAARAAERGAILEHVQREAVDLSVPEQGRALLTLADGQVLAGDVVVLATGLFPAVRALQDDPRPDLPRRILQDPWDPAAIAALPKDGAIAIVGSCLSMVDAVVSLEQTGHRGPIHVISRHGQVAHSRRAVPAGPDALKDETAKSLARLLCKVRRLCRVELAGGGDWQSVVDPIRPHIARLWSQASDEVRHRFVRHLRPWWESHHHRSPPASGALVARLRAEGRLSVRAATIHAARHTADGRVTIELRDRHASAPAVLHVDALINSSGIEYDWTRVRHAFPRNLLRRGHVRPGPIGLGIDADAGGAVIGCSGRPSDRLFSLGPPLRGLWWESTAVPDIVAQAGVLADRLAGLPPSAVPIAPARRRQAAG